MPAIACCFWAQITPTSLLFDDLLKYFRLDLSKASYYLLCFLWKILCKNHQNLTRSGWNFQECRIHRMRKGNTTVPADRSVNVDSPLQRADTYANIMTASNGSSLSLAQDQESENSEVRKDVTNNHISVNAIAHVFHARAEL